MRRPNTIAFGSGIDPSARPARALGSDPGKRPLPTEAEWFAPTNPTLQPIGHQLEERRGWRPPPPTKGVGFAIVSVLLVTIAAGGTLFFFGPDAERPRSSSRPVSTTTITNADVPSTTATEERAPSTTAIPTATPAELPSAPSTSKPASTATRATAARQPGAGVRAPGRVTTDRPAPATKATPATRPAPAKPAPDRALPDLDRAAAAAGLTPRDDEPLSTPDNGTPSVAATTQTTTQTASPIQTAAPSVATPPPDPTASPAPSDVLPGLQIKR
jgi:hypothetical protein